MSVRLKWWKELKTRYELFWDFSAALLFIIIVWAPFIVAAIVIWNVVTNV